MTTNEEQATVPYGLYAVVFVCGGALMGLEMAGARLLDPHFGSNIYVWGAIIGLFMGAMSLGYYLGGRLADRAPRWPVLGGVILLAGAATFVVPWLAPTLCRSLNTWNLDPKYRALLASLVLFAVPTLLLGMVSPFAVRLAAARRVGIGRVAGGLYAVSTFGSLAGTFLVSFVLVEWMGSQKITWTMGAALVVTGALCFLLSAGTSRGAKGLAAGGAALLAVAGYGGALTPMVVQPVYATELETYESAYHHIAVTEQYSLVDRTGQTPARYMLFNNQIESGIELAGAPLGRDADNLPLPPPAGLPVKHPVLTACGYVRMLHLGMLFTERAPARTLVIGCGGGVGPLMFKEHYADAVERIDVVDIDPHVFRLAGKYFDYPYPTDPDGVIHSHTADGRLYVEQAKDARWDYVVMDAYTSGGRIPKHLATEEFFELARARVAPGGVFVANIISRADVPREGKDTSRLFRAVYKTLEKVYAPHGGELYVFPRRRDASSNGENIIIVATQGQPRLSRRDIESRYAVLSGTLFRHVPVKEYVDRYLPPNPAFGGRPAPVEDVPLLTDDFCPTDSMVYQ